MACAGVVSPESAASIRVAAPGSPTMGAHAATRHSRVSSIGASPINRLPRTIHPPLPLWPLPLLRRFHLVVERVENGSRLERHFALQVVLRGVAWSVGYSGHGEQVLFTGEVVVVDPTAVAHLAAHSRVVAPDVHVRKGRRGGFRAVPQAPALLGYLVVLYRAVGGRQRAAVHDPATVAPARYGEGGEVGGVVHHVHALHGQRCRVVDAATRVVAGVTADDAVGDGHEDRKSTR